MHGLSPIYFGSHILLIHHFTFKHKICFDCTHFDNILYSFGLATSASVSLHKMCHIAPFTTFANSGKAYYGFNKAVRCCKAAAGIAGTIAPGDAATISTYMEIISPSTASSCNYDSYGTVMIW